MTTRGQRFFKCPGCQKKGVWLSQWECGGAALAARWYCRYCDWGAFVDGISLQSQQARQELRDANPDRAGEVEVSRLAQEARTALIWLAQQEELTSEVALYDYLAPRCAWPARDSELYWRDQRLYPVLREVSDDNRRRDEPLLWSLVLVGEGDPR